MGPCLVTLTLRHVRQAASTAIGLQVQARAAQGWCWCCYCTIHAAKLQVPCRLLLLAAAAAHRCTCPLLVWLLLQLSSPQGKTGKRWQSCCQCAQSWAGTGPWGRHGPHSAPRTCQVAPGTRHSFLCGVSCSWVVPAGLTGRAGRTAAGCRLAHSCCQCTPRQAGSWKQAVRSRPWQLQQQQETQMFMVMAERQ
jgi:hypothetical protein